MQRENDFLSILVSRIPGASARGRAYPPARVPGFPVADGVLTSGSA
ncbi:hypothetical protein [Oleispirillum naphthae]